jgi:hypothetical protein
MGRVGIGETHAFGSKLVDRWSSNFACGQIATHIAPTEIIREDNDDVWLSVLRSGGGRIDDNGKGNQTAKEK